MPKVDIELKFFTAISIDFLLVDRNKYCLQVYSKNCAIKYKVEKLKIICMTIFLKIRYYKCYITLEFIYVEELILLKLM